jgi:hypothetical protein
MFERPRSEVPLLGPFFSTFCASPVCGESSAIAASSAPAIRRDCEIHVRLLLLHIDPHLHGPAPCRHFAEDVPKSVSRAKTTLGCWEIA